MIIVNCKGPFSFFNWRCERMSKIQSFAEKWVNRHEIWSWESVASRSIKHTWLIICYLFFGWTVSVSLLSLIKMIELMDSNWFCFFHFIFLPFATPSSIRWRESTRIGTKNHLVLTYNNQILYYDFILAETCQQNLHRHRYVKLDIVLLTTRNYPMTDDTNHWKCFPLGFFLKELVAV